MVSSCCGARMSSPPSFRLHAIDLENLDALPDPLAAIGAGEYGALVVRGVFGREELRDAVDELEAAPEHRSRHFPGTAIEFIGLPLQGCGVDLGPYHASIAVVEAACALQPRLRLVQRAYDVLERVARRPVRPFRGEGGAYVPATLRRMPPGEEVGPHFELGQLDAPGYAELRGRVDVTTIFSFYIALRAPEEGGELAIYDFLWSDLDAAKVRSRDRPEGSLLFDRYEPVLVAPTEGDLLVFDSGRHAHRVLPIRGAWARWTAGGLLAYAPGGREVLAWA